MRAALAGVVAVAVLASIMGVPADAQVDPVTVSVSNKCPSSDSPGGFTITVTSAVAVPVGVSAQIVDANRSFPITPNPIPPFETGRFDGPVIEGGSFIGGFTIRVSWSYTIGTDEFIGFDDTSITVIGRCWPVVTTTEPPTTLEADTTTTSEAMAVEDSSTTVAPTSTVASRSTATPSFAG